MIDTYKPIATQTLSSNQTSISFTSIPQTYTDLILMCGNLGMSTNGSAGRLRFNSDSSSIYSATWLVGNGSSVSANRDSAQNSMRIIGALVGPSNTKSDSYIFSINNYANSTTYKTVIGRGAAATESYEITGLWKNTSAISSITIISYNGTDSFLSGSTFTLYGIKAA